LRADDLPAFERAFVEEVARWIDEDTLAGHLLSDGELHFGEFTVETAAALREGGPWGSGFPEPCFDGRFGVIESRVVGERHLKLRVRTGYGEAVDAIAFRYLDDPEAPAIRAHDEVEMVYRPGIDDYSRVSRLQLVTEWLAPVVARG
jgi:single-stranded-DNA-specific exonuclease